MVTRDHTVPGVSSYPARVKRATTRLLARRNADGGFGPVRGAPSTIPDTSHFLTIAQLTGETWDDAQPSIVFLRDELDLALASPNPPTEHITCAIRGLTSVTQSSSVHGVVLVLRDAVRLLADARFEGAWAEERERSEISMIASARAILALRELAHFFRVNHEYGIQTFSEEEMIECVDMIESAVVALLQHRVHGRGWRFTAESTGGLSWAATAECLLALNAARDLLRTRHGDRGGVRYSIGAAENESARSASLESIVDESAWWLVRNHDRWAGQIESDAASAVQPWTRLTYSSALQASLLVAPGLGSMHVALAHLESLWSEEHEQWGEWDGNIPAPTMRGAAFAVAALAAARKALLSRSWEALELPESYEPVSGIVTEATLEVSADRSWIELEYDGRSVRFSRPRDEIRVLEAIIGSGAFGLEYNDIELATRIPKAHHWTLIDRMNRATGAATLFRLALLVRLPGSRARWRLNPAVSQARVESAAG